MSLKFTTKTSNKLPRFNYRGLALVGALVLLPAIVMGQMGSTNYQMVSDSLNFGGGKSQSTNFNLDDTLGEVATGLSSSTNFEMRGGFQQIDRWPIAISTTGNVTMPSIGGISANTSTASMTTTVETRNPAGYELSIKASTAPAMQSATDNFADYVPATADPDFGFTLASGVDGFGFSPEGPDTASRYLDNGSACNTGSSNAVNSCWDGLAVTDKLIATKAVATDVGGNDTDIVFRAGLGEDVMKAPESYTATITVTAVAL